MELIFPGNKESIRKKVCKTAKTEKRNHSQYRKDCEDEKRDNDRKRKKSENCSESE